MQGVHLLLLEHNAGVPLILIHHIRAVPWYSFNPNSKATVPLSHPSTAATAIPAASTRQTQRIRTAGLTLCGAAPCTHQTQPPKLTSARLSQVHLVDHDVPRPQRHSAHHNHGPLRVRPFSSTQPLLSYICRRSVDASVFGLIYRYLAMIISTVTNMLSLTPDEQALVSASPGFLPASHLQPSPPPLPVCH